MEFAIQGKRRRSVRLKGCQEKPDGEVLFRAALPGEEQFFGTSLCKVFAHAYRRQQLPARRSRRVLLHAVIALVWGEVRTNMD
jgi:hypothetical protein